MALADYLRPLNKYQLQAVTAEEKYLQVLAGPGSGKTRVLTTRVAWLIKEKKIRPSSIVVVTFTNKAAKEMKERLNEPSLLGARTDHLQMGTFHAFCNRMLRRHLVWTPLKKGFAIADASKSKHLVDIVFKDLKARLSPYSRDKKSAEFHGFISRAKNEGIDHHEYMAKFGKDRFKKDTAIVFSAYEEMLQTSNMVDFDGLLLHARNLFKNYPESVDFVNHVLVDEFQDTNSLQYELLRLLTHNGEKAVTVVGDPDQSIYGWRSANPEHFSSMEKQFKGTRIVDLKENYRSTKNILSSATSVVETDKSRKQRELFTDNHAGAPISILKASSDVEEAKMVSNEIKRIVKFSNGLINYKDIAILFRANFLTNNFEIALRYANIPHVLVGGTRFLDRMEVKDILGYLSFFYNPHDLSAFIRLINVPKRGLGDVTIKKLQFVAQAENWSMLEAMQHVVAGHPKTISIRVMAKSKTLLQNLLDLYHEVNDQIIKREPLGRILEWIIDAIGYMDYLKTSYSKDYESRIQNVQELITFANRHTEDDTNDESGIEAVGRFLENCTLSGDTKEHEEALGGRVSLITIHSAKGLEWPCVFIAGCEDGLIPMAIAEDQEEESRVMYVGMTRAKAFLYCTLAAERLRWNGPVSTELSPYLDHLPASGYQRRTPAWNTDVRKWTAQVLRLDYIEDAKLDLEDPGTGIYSDNEGDYFDGNFGNFEDYDEYDEYDNYDENDGNDTPCRNNSANLVAYGTPETSTQHHHSGPKSTATSTSTAPPLHKVKKEVRSTETPTMKLAQQLQKEIKTEPSSIHRSNTALSTSATFSSVLDTIKGENNIFANDTKPDRTVLESLKCAQKTKQPIKREGTDSPKPNKKSKKQKTATQEARTPKPTFTECVTNGIHAAGVGKNSFSLQDVILAVENETRTTQLEPPSGSTVRGEVIEKLGYLVGNGSLCRINKDGAHRYFVTE